MILDALPPNRFKRALAAGTPQIGLWLSLGNPTAAEVVAGAGFDWCLVDMEHAPNDMADIASQLRAMSGGTAEPVVRPPWNDAIVLKRLLDIGARSFLIPFVQSAEEARRAVAATRYPPAGMRGVATVTRANGYGRVPTYFRDYDREICVLVQLETRRTMDAIEEIAAVDGVDGIFVGPSDLAADMGHAGNPLHPEVQEAIKAAGARIRKAGKAPGYLTSREEEIRRRLADGFGFVAVGSDVGILARQSEALAKAYRTP